MLPLNAMTTSHIPKPPTCDTAKAAAARTFLGLNLITINSVSRLLARARISCSHNRSATSTMNFLNARTPATGRTGGAGTGTAAAAVKGLVELTMYKEAPAGEVSVEEFEKYALDRLRVLKAIEEAKLRGKTDDVIQEDVKGLLQKHMQGGSPQETRRKDLISHHILRLAYCRSAELRNWLLQHEALLFKYRFAQLSSPEQVDFFSSMELPYQPISGAEAEELAEDLAAVALSFGDKELYGRILKGCSGKGASSTAAAAAGRLSDVQGLPDGKLGRVMFFKVPFAAVPDLVARRQVLLRDGYAYVREAQVGSLVVGCFRMHLSAALTETAWAWGNFTATEADRLAPLVDNLPNRSLYESSGRNLPMDEITAGQLPQLVAGRHLPLCMTVMYERLTGEHHLKHWGLQQFSLFLKAIGMPLEQAMLFFRHQFSPRTPGDKFQKEYAYNIRYNYGQEGKRENWSEWSCVKIISQEVGGACAASGECNGGCPYKTYDQQQLRTALSRLNCNDRVIKDVLDKVRGKHYQLACGLAFEGITGIQQDTGINKPSEYYAASIELEKQRVAAAAAAEGGNNGGKQQQQPQQQPQQQQQQQQAPPSTPMAAPGTATA